MAAARLKKEKVKLQLSDIIREAYQIPDTKEDQIRCLLDEKRGVDEVKGSLEELAVYCATHHSTAEKQLKPAAEKQLRGRRSSDKKFSLSSSGGGKSVKFAPSPPGSS